MEYVEAVRRHWLVALLIVLSVVLATGAVTLLQPRQYTATNRQYVGVRGGDSITDLAQKVSVTADLMTSYAQLARSPLVLDTVIAQLDLTTDSRQLAQQVTATVPLGTVVLEVTVTDEDPARAAAISNAVARQFGVVVEGLPQVQAGKSDGVYATVIQTALPPLTPSSPDLTLNLGVALALGVVLAIIVSLLLAKYRPVRRLRSTPPAVPDWN